MQSKDKTLLHQLQDRPWECVGADILSKNSKHYLCIINYHRIVLVIKQAEGLSADYLIKTCMIIFAEYRFPNRLMSDSGTNFISEKFQDFCRCLGIHHAVSSSYNHAISCVICNRAQV